MIYVLWGLLNIILFILFILYCFKITRLIREKIGFFATAILVLGLLSFVKHSNSDNKDSHSSQIKTWNFNSENNLTKKDNHFLNIDMEETSISKYTLTIKYGKDIKSQLNTPISAFSSTTGFTSGTNWNPSKIIINRTNDNNKFEYSVFGAVEWKLLFIPIYSQRKEYKGIAVTK